MKKIFLLICLFLTCKAYSQNNPSNSTGTLSFISNTKWCVEVYFGTGAAAEDIVATKDTLFSNGYVYREYNSYYFIREDTTLKKVWVVWPDSSNETLLYNFSLQPGDNFKVHYIAGGWNVTYHLDSIKAIKILSRNSRRFFFSTKDTPLFRTITWVEGIGAETSPLYPIEPSAYNTKDTFNNGGYCLIAAIGDSINYLGACMIGYLPSLICNDLPFNSVVNLSESNFTIYPNPSSGKVYVQPNNLMPASIVVYNCYGRPLSQKTAVGGTISVDFSAYSSGIYYIQVIQNNKATIRKVCKL